MALKTTDYKQFKLLHSNRDVDQQHVERLARSMEEYPDLFAIRPILVNEDMQVIDGQHRLAAAKLKGLPVWYEIGGDLKAVDAIALNRNQKNWTLVDFVNSHAKEGNQDYIKLKEIIEEYPMIAPTTIVNYLVGQQQHGFTIQLREGKFKITDESQSRQYLDQLEQLIEVSPAFRLRTAADAMHRIFKSPEYNHDRMVRKMMQWGDAQFNPYGTGADILRSIENVYNYKQPEATLARLY